MRDPREDESAAEAVPTATKRAVPMSTGEYKAFVRHLRRMGVANADIPKARPAPTSSPPSLGGNRATRRANKAKGRRR